jgi:hypothetical protein
MPRHRTVLRVLSLGLVGLLSLVACGKKGDPLPPLRQIPVAARDLSVHQQGTTLILRLAYPQSTTSGGVLPGLEALEIYDLVSSAGREEAMAIDRRAYASAAAKVVEIASAELASAVIGDRLEVRIGLEVLPLAAADGSAAGAQDAAGAEPRRLTHIFAVRSRSTTAEVSDLSNLIAIVLVPTFPAPSELTVEAQPEGVALAWSFAEDPELAGFTVYRKLADERRYGEPRARLEATARAYVDPSASYGSRYIYTVRAVASADPLVESGPSAEREVDYQDRFAPAPPPRVLALGEDGRVRLVIEPSPATDVARYVVYRRDPTAAADFRRITETTADRLELLDSGLASGLRYIYRATAVDGAGNEGPPSQEVTVRVP